MPRLFRVAVLTAVMTVLTVYSTAPHTAVANDDLATDQHLVTTVDTEHVGVATSLPHDVALAVPSDTPASEFETWWIGTFDVDERLTIDEPGVPAIPVEPAGTVTENSHGDVFGSVNSANYAEATSGSALEVTSHHDGPDAWWSFAQPVIDAIEDTLGWTMFGIIFGGFVILLAVLMAVRRRRRSGAVGEGQSEVAYNPATTQTAPQFAAGATFMPQGAQAAPAQQGFTPQGPTPHGHQPLQGYPFHQG